MAGVVVLGGVVVVNEGVIVVGVVVDDEAVVAGGIVVVDKGNIVVFEGVAESVISVVESDELVVFLELWVNVISVEDAVVTPSVVDSVEPSVFVELSAVDESDVGSAVLMKPLVDSKVVCWLELDRSLVPSVNVVSVELSDGCSVVDSGEVSVEGGTVSVLSSNSS